MLKITLIKSKGCVHCEQTKNILVKLKADYSDLTFEEIEATTSEGQALIIEHGIFSSPGILINDKFFAMGGATEEQFRKKFEELRKI